MPLATLVAKLLPIAFKAVEQGVFWQIIGKALELLRLVLPLIDDPDTRAEVIDAAQEIESFRARPAQPEDPAMQHAAGRQTGTPGMTHAPDPKLDPADPYGWDKRA